MKLKAFLLTSLFAHTALPTTTTQEGAKSPSFSHFWGIAETLSLIEKKAYRSVSLGSIVEEGLRAMVNKLDAHSAFFSPRTYKTSVECASGQFPGIGILTLGKETESDTLPVVQTTRGGPADKAGIKSGDTILKIDKKKVRGLTSDEVVHLLKGPVGSKAKITLIRDKKPLKVVVTRELIQDRSAYGYFIKEHNCTYISLSSFSEKTAAQTEKYLKESMKRSARAVILDLRKNAGGVVDAAVDVARLFVPDGSTIAVTKNNKKVVERSYTTHGAPLYTGTIPLLILVDNFTASAAEILAGALQHHAGVHNLPIFIIGMPTYGKGSVQEIIPLHNGCAVKLTVFMYYLPNDQCIQALGITPDIVVKPKVVPEHELKWVNNLMGKETALTGHITRAEVEGEKTEEKKAMTSQKTASRDFEAEAIEALSNDHVVQTALTLMHTWHLGKKAVPDELSSHPTSKAFLKKSVVSSTFEAQSL